MLNNSDAITATIGTNTCGTNVIATTEGENRIVVLLIYP